MTSNMDRAISRAEQAAQKLRRIREDALQEVRNVRAADLQGPVQDLELAERLVRCEMRGRSWGECPYT